MENPIQYIETLESIAQNCKVTRTLYNGTAFEEIVKPEAYNNIQKEIRRVRALHNIF